MLNKLQIFNDSMVSQCFPETECSTQYEFIAVINGQTTTFAFHKVVQQHY